MVRVVPFWLRLSTKHRHYRTKFNEITDAVELETAKQQLLLHSQKEKHEVEYLLLSSDKTVETSSRIAYYAPFIDPASICSTGRSRHLVKSEYDAQHPKILDGRHTRVKLIVIVLSTSFRLSASCNSLRNAVLNL